MKTHFSSDFVHSGGAHDAEALRRVSPEPDSHSYCMISSPLVPRTAAEGDSWLCRCPLMMASSAWSDSDGCGSAEYLCSGHSVRHPRLRWSWSSAQRRGKDVEALLSRKMESIQCGSNSINPTWNRGLARPPMRHWPYPTLCYPQPMTAPASTRALVNVHGYRAARIG